MEACSSWAEHVGPRCIDVNVPGVPFIGPNLVVKDDLPTSITRPESLKLTPELQGRKWVRIDHPD